jgi:hypothetical protein
MSHKQSRIGPSLSAGVLLASLVLAGGVASAAPGGIPGPNPDAPGQNKAPEIDLGSGGHALALLAGGLLLAGERARSTRKR